MHSLNFTVCFTLRLPSHLKCTLRESTRLLWPLLFRVRLGGESLIAGGHYWSGVCLKEVREKGGRVEEGGGVRAGVRDSDQDLLPSLSPGCGLKYDSFLFRRRQCTCRTPEGVSSPSPLVIPKISPSCSHLNRDFSVYIVCPALHSDNGLFCESTTKDKTKEVALQPLPGFDFFSLGASCFLFPSVASKRSAEFTPLAPKQKAPRFVSLALFI